MAQSKPVREETAGRNVGAFSASTDYNTPVLADRFDRFCTSCGFVIENLALEKYPDLKCSNLKCGQPVEFLHNSDGLYRRCVRCEVFLRCTAKFCYMCGRPNQYFDPEKPQRLERAQKAKLRNELKEEFREELKKEMSRVPEKKMFEEHEHKRRKLEQEKDINFLSESCIEDGEFEEEKDQEKTEPEVGSQ